MVADIIFQHHANQLVSAAAVFAAVGLADFRRHHGIAAILDAPRIAVVINDRFVVFLAKVNLDQVFHALGLPFIQNFRQIVGVDEDIPAEIHAEQAAFGVCPP